MPKSIELLLVESVENLGIVGDVVKVRTGYARNYLLPRAVATQPSEELIKSLQAKRADAQKQLEQQRQMRAETITRLTGYTLEITRACNDQGILYASVTQQEIAAALTQAGYAVRPRDVRMSGAIKRVDSYDVHVKYETELETWIKLTVKPDRVLAKDEKPDLDFDMEGNLVEKRSRKGDRAEKAEGAEIAEGAEAKGEKKAKKADKPEAEKPAPVAEDDAPKKAVKKPRGDVKKDAKADKKA